MMTPATILCRVGRVDFEERSASFFRFARKLLKELRPCRVGNTFCQTMIMNHPIDMQIFHTDGSKGVDDASTVLMGEVVASPFGSFMNTSKERPFIPGFKMRGFLAHYCNYNYKDKKT
jgi:hypothetical protein